MVPADSRGIPRVPRYSGYRPPDESLRVRGSHPLRPPFPGAFHSRHGRLTTVLQPRRRLDAGGLGSSAFARHYSRNHCYFLLLWVLRCFSSPRSPPPIRGMPSLRPAGCPIRKPRDQGIFAPPPGLSRLIASFVASESLGIHRPPLLTSSCPAALAAADRYLSTLYSLS